MCGGVEGEAGMGMGMGMGRGEEEKRVDTYAAGWVWKHYLYGYVLQTLLGNCDAYLVTS